MVLIFDHPQQQDIIDIPVQSTSVLRKTSCDTVTSGGCVPNVTMSTSQRPMFNVFRKVKFDDSIEKIEWRTYYPYTRSFRNNDVIEIVINQSTLFDATYDSQLLVSGKIIKTGDGDVSFVNNAAAFMFSSVKYVLGGGSKEMELVQDTGIHFFNIFNDYRTVICGMQTFTFTRANNDANCFLVKEKTPTGNTTVKMDIENVELKIKRIYPESGIKEILLEGVAANNSIIIPYRQWDVQVKSLPAGAISDAWAVKTTSHIESPRYVIVCFQVEKLDNLNKDPTYFDHINITNIKLSLNAEGFPTERMRLNFGNNDYNEAHFRYTEFQSSYLNCSEKRPLLDYNVFKERTLFVIDCSRRDKDERPSTVDVRLEIEAAQGFPENTKAYCIIIHDCIMEYLPLDNIVNNLKA
ncbi:hypothetical protein NQ315_013404 [Exocentrus adspersus]|uniref:Double jelly roll-like domain-containing protein n=1 Tax=Exocentrus adspersus TaxID=1586481 RepID=A0AAV8VSE4_9CUCU|nr:hypothetical protein NQ315_013404 [Exocentrus adspersus]